MTYRLLVTTTSFLDTPGPHHDRLYAEDLQVVSARGPFSEEGLLAQIRNSGPFDAILCGEDDVTSKVLEIGAPTLKVVSKYGVGLDRIDSAAAQRLGIAIHNTPRVNHTTVSELTFGLLIALTRKIPEHNTHVHRAEWRRMTGIELTGKTLGVIGLGRVGKEVVKRALAFGMKVLVYNTNWSSQHAAFVANMNRIFSDPEFAEYPPTVEYSKNLEQLLRDSDMLTLHMNYSKENKAFLDRSKLAICKRGVFLVNVSRGALVDHHALAESIRRGAVAGYGADVLEPQPVTQENPLLGLSNVILTPHIGSRTFDSVARQGISALENILNTLNAKKAA